MLWRRRVFQSRIVFSDHHVIHSQIDGHRRNTALLDKIIWSVQWRRSSFGTRGSRSTGERATGPKDPVRGPFTVPRPDDMANARRGR